MTEIDLLIDGIIYDSNKTQRRKDFIVTCYAALAGAMFGSAVMLVILYLS